MGQQGNSASNGLFRDNNSFFKGKVGGKIVNKAVIDEKLKKITDNLDEQIKRYKQEKAFTMDETKSYSIWH